jgi:hypothetical protein
MHKVICGKYGVEVILMGHYTSHGNVIVWFAGSYL